MHYVGPSVCPVFVPNLITKSPTKLTFDGNVLCARVTGGTTFQIKTSKVKVKMYC